MPYEFKARFPMDHAFALIQMIRGGEANASQILIHIGAVTGELGALIAEGFPVGTLSQKDRAEVDAIESLDECLKRLEEFESQVVVEADGVAVQAGDDEDQFDPTPWIPLILKLIELWLERNR